MSNGDLTIQEKRKFIMDHMYKNIDFPTLAKTNMRDKLAMIHTENGWE